jgi:hypothetical protein
MANAMIFIIGAERGLPLLKEAHQVSSSSGVSRRLRSLDLLVTPILSSDPSCTPHLGSSSGKPHAGRAHQSPAEGIGTDDLQHRKVQVGELAPQRSSCLQHCADNGLKHSVPFDEVPNARLETPSAYIGLGHGAHWRERRANRDARGHEYRLRQDDSFRCHEGGQRKVA